MEDLLIPMAAILFPVFIIFIIFYFIFTTDYKKEKLKREERMKAIEAGVELPPEPVPQPPTKTPLDNLKEGLAFLAVGLGLLIGVGIFFNKGLLGIPIQFVTIFGFIAIFVGIARVILYKIQSKSEK